MKLHIHSVLVPPVELLVAGAKPEGYERVVDQKDLTEAIDSAVKIILSTDVIKLGGIFTLMIQSAEHKDGLVDIQVQPEIKITSRGVLN